MSNIVPLYVKLLPDEQWDECNELSKAVAIFVYDNIKTENARNSPVVLAMALGRAVNALEKLDMALDEEEIEMINVISTGKELRNE